jgi:hypothetical protein
MGIRSIPRDDPKRHRTNMPRGTSKISLDKGISKIKKAGIKRRHWRRRLNHTCDKPLNAKAVGDDFIFTKTELPEEKPCITPVRDLLNNPHSIVPTSTWKGYGVSVDPILTRFC